MIFTLTATGSDSCNFFRILFFFNVICPVYYLLFHSSLVPFLPKAKLPDFCKLQKAVYLEEMSRGHQVHAVLKAALTAPRSYVCVTFCWKPVSSLSLQNQFDPGQTKNILPGLEGYWSQSKVRSWKMVTMKETSKRETARQQIKICEVKKQQVNHCHFQL